MSVPPRADARDQVTARANGIGTERAVIRRAGTQSAIGRLPMAGHVMRSSNCRVSVIIPVFNSAATLRRAALSVIAQTFQDWELLIIDDGSTDGSAEVAQAVAAIEPRARAIVLPANIGKPRVMNTGAAEAAGEWIALLDADDEYDPRRLETLLAAADAHRADVVADNQLIYDSGARRVVGVALPDERADRRILASEFIARCDAYASFDLGMLKPVVRAEFLRATGIGYRVDARFSEDFLFLAELFAAGANVVTVAEPLYVWTQAFGSISRRWTSTGRGAWRYDFASAIEAHLAVRADFLARGETDFAGLLGRRARAFRRLDRLSEASRLHAEGAPRWRVTAQLLRHPSVWSVVTRRAARRAAEHLKARGLMPVHHRPEAAGAHGGG